MATSIFVWVLFVFLGSQGNVPQPIYSYDTLNECIAAGYDYKKAVCIQVQVDYPRK